MSEVAPSRSDLPEKSLLAEQAHWLAPARARLLRRAAVARRGPVLDLACGFGAVAGELGRRARGPVVAVDRSFRALAEEPVAFGRAVRCCADARHLPFRPGAFELVFCQFAFLWFDAPAVVQEVHRVLAPGGLLTALEPDFGGLIEYPPETACVEIWIAALRRAGADPLIGRKLPGLLARAGFQVQVDLLNRLEPPHWARFRFLRGLALEPEELRRLERIELAAGQQTTQWQAVAHLPIFLITAQKAAAV